MDEDTYLSCLPNTEPFVSIVEDGFGFITNSEGNREIVRRYTFENQNHLTIQVITYGATVTSIKYPDRCGIIDDVLLGFDNIEGYASRKNPYMGAIIGRCANRIAKGHFRIDDFDFQLSKNNGEHHIHGGFIGFDKVNWRSDVQGNKLVLTYLSKNGEEGYPGEVLVSVIYQMTTDNKFVLDMKATSSKPTPINLTNHMYFNLAGHATGIKGLLEHVVCINADKFVATDEDLIPTGCLQNVTGTIWDLRIPQKLGNVLHQIPFGGYDHCMCIHKTDNEFMTFNARVVHPEGGRTLEIYSNQPGIQFYTGNQLPKQVIGGLVVATGKDLVTDIKGKNGVYYYKHQAFCLETQNYPDAVNHNPPDEICSDENDKEQENTKETVKILRLNGKDGATYYFRGGFCLMTEKLPDSVHRKHFPSTIIRPGEIYRHTVYYKFGTTEENGEFEDSSIIDDWEEEGETELYEINDNDIRQTKP